MIDPALASMIVIGNALLLVLAAIHKLKDLEHFTETFAAYQVLPQSAARAVAWVIPCAEIAIAAGLLWPPSRPAAAIGAALVFALYAGGLALNLARNRRDLDCGCAGWGERRSIAAWMIWRNLVLAVLMAFAALPWSARELAGSDLLTIGGGLAAAIILYVAIDRLLGDVAPRAAALRASSL